MATNIKGRGLSGLLRYTKTKVGEEGLKKVLDKLSEEDKAIFSRRVDSSEWYSFKTYVNLLVIIDKELGKGDLRLCEDIGRWSAERDIEAVYKIYTKNDSFKDPITLETAPQVMWKNYYDQGDMVFPEIPKSRDETAPIRARILDFPDAAKPNCSLLGGWICRALEIISDVKVAVTEVKCRADGDEYCEFLLTRKD